MPALAAQSPYSPEFREWYELAQTTNEVLKAKEVWEQANPHADSNSGPAAQLYDALKKLEKQSSPAPFAHRLMSMSWQSSRCIGRKPRRSLAKTSLS